MYKINKQGLIVEQRKQELHAFVENPKCSYNAVQSAAAAFLVLQDI